MAVMQRIDNQCFDQSVWHTRALQKKKKKNPTSFARDRVSLAHGSNRSDTHTHTCTNTHMLVSVLDFLLQ